MEEMSFDHGLQLFSEHAFNRDTPLDDCHILSRDIVFMTGRLPSALEELGVFLCLKRKEI